MKTSAGHLTYCSNIHPGKDWEEDFKALQDNFPDIKQRVSPEQPMGLGLRLSHIASRALMSADQLDAFKRWLKENDVYVFTMNGFPYGEFHRTVVKADVHAPDWTTNERREYTIRLFHILRALLPEGMDGGISTSPLSYRHWFDEASLAEAKTTATLNILDVVKELIRVERETSVYMHLDVEPEPDGILETGREFIDWFEQDLLRLGVPDISSSFAVDAAEAEYLIKRHLCLCYDVCHFAIGYENHQQVLAELQRKGIQVGKIQISAALQAQLGAAGGREGVKKDFERFNEPTYLHQVVALTSTGGRLRYPDLPGALEDFDNPEVCQWRAHFHIPIAVKDFGSLQSTQEDILTLLKLQYNDPFTQHLEVETYTWEILPEQLKLPIAQSISQELNWVLDQLNQLDKTHQHE